MNTKTAMIVSVVLAPILGAAFGVLLHGQVSSEPEVVVTESSPINSDTDNATLLAPTEDSMIATLPDYGAGCKREAPDGLDEGITAASSEFDVDPWVLAALVQHESACNPNAVGAAGEIGLTQINPKIWVPRLRDAGIANSSKDLFNVGVNLRAAAWIIQANGTAKTSKFEQFRRYNGGGPASSAYAKELMARYQKIKN